MNRRLDYPATKRRLPPFRRLKREYLISYHILRLVLYFADKLESIVCMRLSTKRSSAILPFTKVSNTKSCTANDCRPSQHFISHQSHLFDIQHEFNQQCSEASRYLPTCFNTYLHSFKANHIASR